MKDGAFLLKIKYDANTLHMLSYIRLTDHFQLLSESNHLRNIIRFKYTKNHSVY
jgi:hypothetical protein